MCVAQRVNQRVCAQDFEVQGVDLPQRPGKRMRVDEDFRRFVSVDVVQAHRARSGAQFLRGAGTVAASSGPKWEEKELAAYLEAGTRCFEGCQILAVSSDAARLGDPAEETVVYSVWSPEANCAFVGPCQALSDSAYPFLIPRNRFSIPRNPAASEKCDTFEKTPIPRNLFLIPRNRFVFGGDSA